MRPIHSGGGGVDENAAELNAEQDHAMRLLGYALLRKLGDIVCKKSVYRERKYHNPFSHTHLRPLLRSHGVQNLPYVFAEMENAVMATLNIKKPVPSPVEVINLDDADVFRVVT